MKSSKSSIVTKIISAVICLLASGGFLCSAQDFGVTNRVSKQRKVSNPSRKTAAAPRQAVRVVFQPKYITKQIKSTDLSVTVLPGTSVALESIGAENKINRSGKAEGESITFESLRAGKYKLSAALEGYESWEGEISLLQDQTTVVPIKLKQSTYNFSIRTNVADGEVRFAPVTILSGKNADGTVNVKELGGFCMAPISGGKATIREMAEGAYILDVRARDVQFQRETVVIEIPEDIPAAIAEAEENPPFAVNLENTLSTGVFNQITVAEAWTLTNNNWRIVAPAGLQAVGAGVALPKAQSFRYYQDFEMQSTVRISANSAVGFVVRARDANNFYLIQLTGAAADEPYLVSGWVVKDGKLTERVLANPIKFILEADITKEKHFEVIIKAKGNTFEIFAVDSTGKQKPLGNAIFKDGDFPIGAVGFGSLSEKANFQIGRFTVCNQSCNF